tara:strand:- start:483 stop:629 length:147 start_codon:yes stop_codon:yes gene_type:complete
MLKLITKLKNDPVYNCDVYKKIGCGHVDGFLCKMKTCEILRNYKINDN